MSGTSSAAPLPVSADDVLANSAREPTRTTASDSAPDRRRERSNSNSDSWSAPSPYLAHRRHLVAQLLHAFPPLLLYQHLLSPNLLSLVVRVLIQIRLCSPRLRHPGTSLLQLSLGVFALNAVIFMMHILDLIDGVENIGKGLVLDFVGLRTPPRPSTIYILDALCTLWQLVTLNVAYLSDPIPSGQDSSGEAKQVDLTGGSYDPLLPSSASVSTIVGKFRARISKRRRRGQGNRRRKTPASVGRARGDGHDEAEQGLLASDDTAAGDTADGDNDDADDYAADLTWEEDDDDDDDDDDEGEVSERDSLLENERGPSVHLSRRASVDKDHRAGVASDDDDGLLGSDAASLIVDLPFMHFFRTIWSWPSPPSAFSRMITTLGDATSTGVSASLPSRAAETERRETISRTRRAAMPGSMPVAAAVSNEEVARLAAESRGDSG